MISGGGAEEIEWTAEDDAITGRILDETANNPKLKNRF